MELDGSFYIFPIKGSVRSIAKKIDKKVSGKNLNLTFKIGFFRFFLKILKRGNFILQISLKIWHLQKKCDMPRQSPWKMQQNCQFRILIFKTLSQRFFHLEFRVFFSNFDNWKILKWQTLNRKMFVTKVWKSKNLNREFCCIFLWLCHGIPQQVWKSCLRQCYLWQV